MSEANQNTLQAIPIAEPTRVSQAKPRFEPVLDELKPVRVRDSDQQPSEAENSAGTVGSNAALKALGNVKLSITIDETEHLPVIKIFDSESGKELLQVPAEHSLNIARTIRAAVGAIFDEKV